MKRTVAALVAGIVLGVTGIAAASTKPDPAAISYWKAHALAKSWLNPWWRGYLGGGENKLTGCHFAHAAGGVTFYECFVENRIDNLKLAIAALVKLSRHHYAAEWQSLHGKKHTYTHRFRHG
jgi:hypothetical protein